MMDQSLLIPATASIQEALARIEANHLGAVFVVGDAGIVIGIATDGDIRRSLLSGGGLNAAIADICNRDFIWASDQTSRELLLKQLDNRIRLIPVLDADRRLTSVVTRDQMPHRIEERVYARARAPVRVSFGGGGSDLTHYFSDETGAVISSTISLYSHATMRRREDSRICIHSRDLNESLDAPDLEAALANPGSFRLIAAILKTVRPGYGLDLYLHSDFPVGSGLGGSAVVAAAVLGCFNQFRQDQWDAHEMAELAFQAERLHLGIAGGWQDQYAAVFGGFNFMEFRMEQNIVHPLRIQSDILAELEESLVLCDTGVSHDSGNIHDDQREQMSQDSVRHHVKKNVELTYRIRNDLLRGRLTQFGHGLHEAWMLKRQLSSKISNAQIDSQYSVALEAGALGGKLLGAGGGGFFLFYSPPFARHQLMSALEGAGLSIRPFRFEPEGLRAWKVRESSIATEQPK
jgi:D-glycero-alpha-D-manno-heptose-7-phosphate kinase